MLKITGLLLSLAVAASAKIPLKHDDRIIFLGDSITQFGAGSVGYVTLFSKGLSANGVDVVAQASGFSGDTSSRILQRLDHDVLSKKPNWVVLSCGVNDVLNGVAGVPLETYKRDVERIVADCQKAGIKVMLMTTTMIGEDEESSFNRALIPYNDFLRSLAKRKQLRMSDIDRAFRDDLSRRSRSGQMKGLLLTRDGIHMNPMGNILMAQEVLRGFSLNDAQIAKATQAMYDQKATVSESVSLTLWQYVQLDAVASKAGTTLDVVLRTIINQGISELIRKNNVPLRE